MQRQQSTVGSLPEVIAFDHGSTSSDGPGFVPQMCWTNMENSSQTQVSDDPGHDFCRWDFAESSSRSAHDEIGGNDGPHQPPQDLNMNCVEDEDDEEDDDDDDNCQLLENPLYLNPNGLRTEQQLYASSSSNPFGAPPRYSVDEIHGSQECLWDHGGRRLSSKRKSPEGNVVPSESEGGGSSTSNDIPRLNETNLNFSPQEQVNPRLGLSFGQVGSDSFPSLYASGNSSSFRRNFRLRINASHQQDHSSSRSFLPSSNLLDSSGSVSTASNGNIEGQPVPVLVRVPSLRPVSQSMWNGSTGLENGATGSRNGPQHEARSLPGLNVDVSGNVASASGSWVPPDQSSSQNNPHRLAECFRRSLVADTVVSGGGGQNGGDHLHSGSSSSSQEIPESSGSGSQGRHSYSRSAMLLERRNNGAHGIPYSLRSLNLAVAGGDGRSRLVSEMRNVLDLVRRGDGLRFEVWLFVTSAKDIGDPSTIKIDVMMLDQSVFFGVADRYDRHRDMRLDVDNMSYEELLELEEHIGSVNIGLTEECISKQLKQRNYTNTEIGEEKIEPCCICQEEYNNGEVVGLLECGHDFHVECIKKWLMLKNLCPICKTTGLTKNM